MWPLTFEELIALTSLYFLHNFINLEWAFLLGNEHEKLQ